MKQKAQIDILDLPLIEGEGDAGVVADGGESTAPPEGKVNRGRILYIAIAAIVVLIMAAAGTGYYLWFPKSEKKTVTAVAETAAPGLKPYMAVIDDFNIDVKDDKGVVRLLSCGFMLELDRHENGKDLEGRVEIRKLIFDTLHKRKVSDLIKNDEKKEIKKEITAGVNRLLGAEKVKETYITKFVLL